MPATTHRVRVEFARRMPHATLPNVEKHFFNVRVKDIHEALRLDANPRDAKGKDLNRQVYKDVRNSLLGEDPRPGIFDLMNRGLTIIASKVVKISDNEYELTLDDGEGVADGGHTQELLLKYASDPDLPPEQTVDFKVISGVSGDIITDIAKGLNTGLQVRDHTIAHHKGDFAWLKSIIEKQPYGALFSWQENEAGDYDVRDLICLIEALNVIDFPNNRGSHPIHAYEKSSKALRNFVEAPEKYESFGDLMTDALFLYDTIRHDFYFVHNKAGGSAGALKICEAARPGRKLEFPFAGLKAEAYRLHKGPTFPMFAAFRNLVKIDKESGRAIWIGGFDNVLRVWREYGPEMVNATFLATKDVGRFPDQLGKARSLWDGLHTKLKMRLFEERDGEL